MRKIMNHLPGFTVFLGLIATMVGLSLSAIFGFYELISHSPIDGQTFADALHEAAAPTWRGKMVFFGLMMITLGLLLEFIRVLLTKLITTHQSKA